MKCENCGGNLSLEAVACPHCGTINKHAQQHVRDMNRYQGEFQDTRQEVYTVTRNYAGITARAAIIAGLVVLTAIFVAITAFSYDIKRGILESKAKRNVKEYTAVLDQFLAEENYMAFNAFVDANYLSRYDMPFEKYTPIYRASSQYTYLYQYIMDLNMALKEIENKGESDRVDCGDCIERIAEQLNYFYEYTDLEQYSYYEGAVSEENRAVLQRMEENINALLQAYCGLTEEDIAGLRELSKAKRMMLLEERIGYAE